MIPLKQEELNCLDEAKLTQPFSASCFVAHKRHKRKYEAEFNRKLICTYLVLLGERWGPVLESWLISFPEWFPAFIN